MAVTPLYTTQTKIEKRVGTSGTDLRIDDDTDSIDNVIEDATTEVNGYCQRLYDTTTLATSEWVMKKTTDIAVFFLCLRRLNSAPKAAQFMYEKAIMDLEKIQAGMMMIPDIPMTKASVPVMSNQSVRMRPWPRVVTDRGRSTGTAEGYRKFDNTSDFFDYTI